jgi:hypothetical protein
MAGFIQEQRGWLKGEWKALLAVAVIGLLPFIGFLTAPGRALYASDQLGSPAWRFYFEALRRGIIPMWHPYGQGGMPSFDAGFGDASYLPSVLLGMFLNLTTFVSWSFVLHVAIAGLGAYYLLRRLFGLERPLAVALAVAYMLNTNYISHIHAGHTGKFYIMTWLPLSLYALLRSLSSAARWYHPVAFSLSIAWLLTTMHPQFLYYVLMGYFLIWAFRSAMLLKEKRAPAAGLLALKFWVPVMAGIGLCFWLLYPPMQYTKSFGIRGSGEKTTYEHATSWSMHPEEAASLVVPEFGGINEKYWGRNPFKLNSEYPGLSVLFLGVLGFAFFFREKDRWFWLWGAIGLLAVLFGLGAHTPLFRLFYSLVPGIKNFRAPSMMLFWLATALWIMSAGALARLSDPKGLSQADRAKKGKRLWQVGFAAAGLLILAGLAPGAVFGMWDSLFGGEGIPNLANRAADQSAFSLGALRAGVLLAALVYATRKWMVDASEPLRYGLALLAVTCVDLMWVNANFIRTYDPREMMPDQPAISYLKSDTSAYRVFGLPGAYDRWYMQYHEIETTDGWTDNEYRIYREYRGNDYANNPNLMANLKQNPDGSVSGSAFLDMLNVKYLAYRLQGDGAIRLAPNASALPRAWFAPAWRTEADSLTLEKMKDPAFDPRALAYVSATTALPAGFAPAQEPSAPAPGANPPPDSAAKARDTAKAAAPAPAAAISTRDRGLDRLNRMAYHVEAKQPGIFVLSEMWFPHWKLTVDGKEETLLRVNYAFRGAALTPGTHEIVLTYASPWIRKGFAVAGLSVLLLAAGAFALAKTAPSAGRGGAGT